MSELTNLIPAAEQVRDATQQGENTANRIGQLFIDIINAAAAGDVDLSDSISNLPRTPFDSVEWYSTQSHGQEDNTGDQRIIFKSGNAVVGFLDVKAATSGFSGLMSAEMADKLEQLPDQIPEMENIAADIAFSASASEVTATVQDANDDWREPQTLPMMATPTRPSGSTQTGSNILGAIRAGILSAAFQNIADLYGQGIELYINGGSSVAVILAGAHLYRGGILEITELDGTECGGQMTIGVQGFNYPIFQSEVLRFEGEMGESMTFDLADAYDQRGFEGQFGIVNTFAISADSGRNMHLRVRVVDAAGASGAGGGIASISCSENGTKVSIIGRDANGNVLTAVDLPVASLTSAGTLSRTDYAKIQSAQGAINAAVANTADTDSIGFTFTKINGQTFNVVLAAATDHFAGIMSATQAYRLQQLTSEAVTNFGTPTGGQAGVIVYYGGIGGTLGTLVFSNATTTAAGMMSASDKTKLNGIAQGAEVNTLIAVTYDATNDPENAHRESLPISNKAADLDSALSGNYSASPIPTGGYEGLAMPANNKNYYIGTVSSLEFDNAMAAMSNGCTIHFIAGVGFEVRTPSIRTINNETVSPDIPTKIAGGDALLCEGGTEYELDIYTICGASGEITNIFSMHALYDVPNETL